jgi:hypothetical protein
MSSIDPALLSAYLDEELDLFHRSLVERALQESPRLARELQRLREVRACLQQLPPVEAPPQLALDLIPRLGEIHELRVRRNAQRKQARLALVVLGPLSAVAAALLVAWSLPTFTHPQPNLAGLPRQPVTPAPAMPPSPAEAEPPASGVVAGTLPGPVDPAPSTPVIDAAREQHALLDQDLLRDLLGRPGVRRLLITVDRHDDDVLERLDETLRNVPRAVPDQARITVAQGLALDPKHPEDAVVYAVVFDDVELKNFRRNVVETVPDVKIDDQPAPPSVLALLAEVPNVDLSPVEPRGTVVAPPLDPVVSIFSKRVSSPYQGRLLSNESLLPLDDLLLLRRSMQATESSTGPMRPRLAGPVPKALEDAFVPRLLHADSGRTRGETVYLVWIRRRA